ncbi:hypothetical protein F5I97DRAFT_1940787 [Phlebopus sp. FC_14]|nr:hypothetical protein F5I97DRAFT_1940787 [Phlebopus sp. FC_14]
MQHSPAVNHPKPLQALLGGVGIALSVHSLLVLNGSVLGVSGFVHRSVQGNRQAVASVLGLIVAGVVAEFLDPGVFSTVNDSSQIILAGFLVGVGTKLANGCTSGHMIAGLSRFSRRQASLVATVTFFTTALATTRIVHHGTLPEIAQASWSLGAKGQVYAIVAPLLFLWAMDFLIMYSRIERAPLSFLASFLTAFTFGGSLRLSNMVDREKILTFFTLPTSGVFDPSLGFLAASALPITTFLYHFARGGECPHFRERWAVPTSTKIDTRLVCGSVLFGIGWGIGGICPGPALVNFGRAIRAGDGIIANALWLISMAIGGILVQ